MQLGPIQPRGDRGPGRLRSRTLALAGALLVGAALVATGPSARPAGAAGTTPHAGRVSYLAVTPRIVPAAAHTFTVNTTADTTDVVPGDGICADSAGNCSLRAAVDEADALQQTVAIDVPAGTYGLTLGTLATSDPAGIVITGAGAGATVVDATAASATAVSVGEGAAQAGGFTKLMGLTVTGGHGTDGGGIDIIDSNDTAELQGVTVTGNTATGGGGGVYAYGTLWATDSTFSDNTASTGGGITNPGSNMRITDCTITGNTAGSAGGGVDARDGTSVFTGGSITGNTLTTGGGEGGGIYALETTMTGTTVSGNVIQGGGYGAGIYVTYGIGPYDHLTVADNTIEPGGTSEGAGIYDDEGTVLTNSTVSGNTLTDGDGGGIYNNGNGEVLAHDVFTGNSANAGAGSGWGGGLYEYDTSTIVDTLISNNHADTAAGGIYNDDALFATGDAIVGNTSDLGAGLYSQNKSQFENTTFSGNVASGASNAGGAVYNDGSPMSLNYVTLSGNVSDLGAGVYDASAGGVIGSSILWNNVTSGGTEAECAVASGAAPFGSAGGNVFGDSSCAHGSLDQVGVDAMIGALGNHGGSTPTYVPMAGSPALGIGGGSCPATDQRGVGRPRGAGCDSGAVQTQSYVMAASDGGVFNFGTAGFFGSMGAVHLNSPVVGIARTPDRRGYWEVASDGGVFNFGDAGFLGSMGGTHLNAPIVGIAAAPDGKGYWEVASDGGIFAFGSAAFYGSMGGTHLNKPIVGIASSSDGGYWEVASDGGVFSFGDASFQGSMGGVTLVRPIVGMSA